jgi:hypothetical protein
VIQRRSLLAAVIVTAAVWGAAAAYSWHFYLDASSWWAGEGLGTETLRAADRRLFLEDALVVTLFTVLAYVAIAVCVRRRRAAATTVAWAIALMGVVAWLVGPVAAPRLDEVMLRCASSSAQGEGGGVDVRGYSWTRFSLIIVRRDLHPSETTCR